MLRIELLRHLVPLLCKIVKVKFYLPWIQEVDPAFAAVPSFATKDSTTAVPISTRKKMIALIPMIDPKYG